jgi:hypothetical protein
MFLTSFLPPPPTTHLSLLRSFIPQRGQHLQDDGILILSAPPVTSDHSPERSTLLVRIVVL